MPDTDSRLANPYRSVSPVGEILRAPATGGAMMLAFLIPLLLLIANFLAIEAPASHWRRPANSLSTVFMALGWFAVTPFLCWWSAGKFSTSAARGLIILWTLAFVVIGLVLNGWAIGVISSR